MPLPRLQLSVIGDEIGPTLDEMISFCAENHLKRLDMRTVEGRNIMSMSIEEAGQISARLESAGIFVPTFVSPLMKWALPDKTLTGGGKVDFAFDPNDCPADEPFAHAFDLAVALGASRIRVFSYLRYEGYQPEDLLATSERLYDLCGRWGMTAEMETEPVCNIGSIAELAAFFANYEYPTNGIDQPPMRPLVDISNHYSMTGQAPSDDDIAQLAPWVDQIHLKDRKLAERRTVPVGDGDIPWGDELKRLLAGVNAPEVLASIETHCPDDRRAATARSVAGIRRIAREIGVEVD
jgi:sugar phosphate isomerase/epimerase